VAIAMHVVRANPLPSPRPSWHRAGIVWEWEEVRRIAESSPDATARPIAELLAALRGKKRAAMEIVVDQLDASTVGDVLLDRRALERLRLLLSDRAIESLALDTATHLHLHGVLALRDARVPASGAVASTPSSAKPASPLTLVGAGDVDATTPLPPVDPALALPPPPPRSPAAFVVACRARRDRVKFLRSHPEFTLSSGSATLVDDAFRAELQLIPPGWFPEARITQAVLIPIEGEPPVPGTAKFRSYLGYDLAHDAEMAALSLLEAELQRPDGELRRAFEEWLAIPTWTRVLDRLATVRQTSHDRLAFRVLAEDIGFRVEALVQEARAAGGFTKGARANVFEANVVALADERERKILADIRAMQMEAEHRAPAGDRLLAVLDALSLHPRVFLGSRGTDPAVLRHVAVRLRVTPVDDEFSLDFDLGGTPRTAAEAARDLAPTGHFAIRIGETTTVLFGKTDPLVSRLAAALAVHPVRFPAQGVERLLHTVVAAGGNVDVILPEALTGTVLDPDTRPLVLLSGLAGGLRMRVMVRPIEGGPMFVPAEGPSRVLAERDGVRASAVRVAEKEIEAADALLAQLPLEGATRAGSFELLVSAGDAAADLLVALANREDVVVTWEEGDSPLHVVARAQTKDLRVRVERKRDWFSIGGEVKVAGESVALAALVRAVRAGRRFVELGRGKILALADELREQLVAASDAMNDTASGLEMSLAGAPALLPLLDDAASLDAVTEFHDLRKRIQRAAVLETPVPSDLRAELRGYQEEGFNWLAGLASWGAGGCLADDMGLGKTVQGLALLIHRAAIGPALVVAPTSVASNWIAEAARFAPSLSVVLYHGSGREEHLASLGPGAVLVTTYDILARDVDALSQIPLATALFDEAQALKNAQSLRAKAAAQIRADVRFALSGTPVENHLGELWSLFRIVLPGLLGSWESFRERFATPIERGRSAPRRRALAALLRPFLLRRTKEEVARELPSKTEVERSITLSPDERITYEAVRQEAVAAAENAGEGPQARFAILAALTRLRLAACHPRLVGDDAPLASSKVGALLELVEEIREAGHRALVFSQFTKHLALAREALDGAGVSYLYLDGSTPAPERPALVQRFQAGEGTLFLISLKAGGTGLNLTGADYVIHMDPWWNPAVEDQATDRAHRIGQTKPVTVVRLVAEATIERAVLSLHAEKRELAQALFDGAEGGGPMETKDLVALLRASPEELESMPSPARAPRAPRPTGPTSTPRPSAPSPPVTPAEGVAPAATQPAVHASVEPAPGTPSRSRRKEGKIPLSREEISSTVDELRALAPAGRAYDRAFQTLRAYMLERAASVADRSAGEVMKEFLTLQRADSNKGQLPFLEEVAAGLTELLDTRRRKR
jgi:superfamily II DNA or RNA helicase